MNFIKRSSCTQTVKNRDFLLTFSSSVDFGQ